jgi:hypothetical protein
MIDSSKCSPNKNEDTTLLLEMLIKCADVSHAAKPLEVHLRWTALITEEFFRQVLMIERKVLWSDDPHAPRRVTQSESCSFLYRLCATDLPVQTFLSNNRASWSSLYLKRLNPFQDSVEIIRG